MLKLGTRSFAAPVLLILIALLVAAAIPGSGASAGSQVHPERYVTGWLPYWNPDAATRVGPKERLGLRGRVAVRLQRRVDRPIDLATELRWLAPYALGSPQQRSARTSPQSPLTCPPRTLLASCVRRSDERLTPGH